MKDGTKSFEVMRRSEINKVRQASQTGALNKTTRDGKAIPPKGPWVDWFGEMARKTVMRRHSKTLPMSGDLIDVEATDESLAARSASHVLAVEPDAPKLAGPSQAEIDAQAAGADPETGELPSDAEVQQSQEGRADGDQGESQTTVDAADALVAEIAGLELVTDVDAFMRNTDLSLLDDDQAQRVEEAADQRLAVLRAKK